MSEQINDDELIRQLMRTEGKAEIIGGRVVKLSGEYVPMGAVSKEEAIAIIEASLENTAHTKSPIFAVEVRSENDYGRRAEAAISAKIADYFAAGTLVVWDVDLRNQDVVAKFTTPDAQNPQFFRRGHVADARPALPDWTFEVNALFPVARPH